MKEYVCKQSTNFTKTSSKRMSTTTYIHTSHIVWRERNCRTIFYMHIAFSHPSSLSSAISHAIFAHSLNIKSHSIGMPHSASTIPGASKQSCVPFLSSFFWDSFEISLSLVPFSGIFSKFLFLYISFSLVADDMECYLIHFEMRLYSIVIS